MQSTLIIAGVAFVGAAIVGGGLVAFKVEIPLVDSVARQIMLGTFGIGLLIAGFTLGGVGNETGESAAPATTFATPVTTSAESVAVATSTVSTGSTVSTTSTTSSAEPDREWALALDEGGKLGVTVPSDWSVVVTEDAIWASPVIDEWTAATNGEGPATHDGYHIERVLQPDTGSPEEIANLYLKDMPVPSQCALTLAFVEPMDVSTSFAYRIYDCVPTGTYINEVEVGFNPPWVTLESSRYLGQQQEEEVFDIIWQSVRVY